MASVFPLPGYPLEGRRPRVKVDGYLVASTIVLLIFGLMSLYSETVANGQPWFRKQLVNLAVGLIPFAVFAGVHPKVWLRSANLLYALNLALLFVVLFHGKHTKGAGRWIPLGSLQFQPSELTKILIVLTLATFYTLRQDRINRASTVVWGLVHVMVPTILVLLQPHLGAAIVMVVIWLAISLVAGVPGRNLCLAGLIGLALMGAFVRGYQLGRVASVVIPQKNLKGANYQTDQAEIAFGVGGVLGTGFLHGEQKAKGYIPEQQNDFVFTVIGEEGGLIGCTLLLLSYGFFFYRIWLAMVQASEPYYKMIAAGIFAILGFHTFVNLAMVLQLLPVVGLWLPFLSYGGTALWLCLASVGLLIGIRRRERPILF